MKRTGEQSSEYAEIAFGGRGREPGGTLFFCGGGDVWPISFTICTAAIINLSDKSSKKEALPYLAAFPSYSPRKYA